MKRKVDIVCDNLREYIFFCLSIEGGLQSLSGDNVPTRREIEFFAVTVENILAGAEDPNTEEAKQRYANNFKKQIKAAEIHAYIIKLKDKGLITYDKNDRRIEIRDLERWRGRDYSITASVSYR